MNQRRIAVSVAIGLALHACSVRASEAESMYNPETYRPLVSEDKAFRIGDILTVIVQETATATAAADSRADRNMSVSGEASTSGSGLHTGKAAVATDSDGGGRTQRSGRLVAQLSVRVMEVLTNGDLIVEGRQNISVNGEVQSITLKGVVRARDIGENNTILSNRIADAAIQFDGDGFIADKSKPGWLSRLLTALGF